MSSYDWYYVRDGKHRGPVPSRDLQRLAASGELRPDDLVWRAGMDRWSPARSMKGLFRASPPAAAAAPAVRPVESAAAAPMNHTDLRSAGESRLLWQLRLTELRLSARRSYDLMGLGTNAGARACAALILAAVFFGAALVAAVLLGFEPATGLALAGLAFGVVLVPSVILILGGSDDDLEGRREELAPKLERLQAARAARAAEAPPPERQKAAESREPPRPTTELCPYCREVIQAGALKCRHCGEFLDERLKARRACEQQHHHQPPPWPPFPRWSPGVAAVLSLVIPGAGQMYKGQILNGLVWLILTLVGYVMCVLPGVLLHLMCILGAASGNPYQD